MKDKKSFVFYLDWQQQLEKLPPEAVGKMVLALCEYVRSGVYPSFDDGALDMCFSFMSAQVDRDTEKYEEICRKRSAVGKKGAEQKKANATKRNKSKQMIANQADTVTDTVTDNDTVTDYFVGVPPEIKTALLEYQDWRISAGKGYRNRNAVKRAVNRLQDLAPDDYQTQNMIIYQALDGQYTQFVSLVDDGRRNKAQKDRLSPADEFAKGGC